MNNLVSLLEKIPMTESIILATLSRAATVPGKKFRIELEGWMFVLRLEDKGFRYSKGNG